MHRELLILGCACLSSLALGVVPSTAQAPAPWHDSLLTRVEALALLQTLNADLLSHDSATLTLDGWCERHRLASPPQVVAEPVPGLDKPPTAAQRAELRVSAAEPVRYRHVRLRCGEHVLSEAENWYVPARLTPDMNRQLEATDAAFGRVVRPLQFRRQTLEATLLWSPLPPGWESTQPVAPQEPAAGGRLEPPHEVLRHRALLLLPDGMPISEVTETYTSAVLAFPEPPPH
ncbi:MAG TPA: hypothetical protein VMG33_12055 [Steroidobacteraceae bacterium]|nr:hypothetical protein [Steroidobacteraceae bacterium]